MDERFSILKKKDRPRRKLTLEEKAARRALRRRQTLKVLPSLFTMGNAVCGFGAIVHVAAIQIDPQTLAMQNPQNLAHAGWLLLLAMLFDALDGRIARMLKTTGDFGGELDSLCDAVSFGVAPALMVVMTNARGLGGHAGHPLWWRFAWLAGLVFVAGAILRLARFNVETQGHEEEAHHWFKGLPSPAAAGAIATLAILQGYLRGAVETQELAGLLADSTLTSLANGISYLLPFVALVTGWLMVSTVRYVHFANRFLKGRRSPRQLAQLVIAGILVFAIVPEIALTATFVGYAFSGPVAHLLTRAPAAEPAETPSEPAAAATAAEPTGEEALDDDDEPAEVAVAAPEPGEQAS